jgi:hypothetical protein
MARETLRSCPPPAASRATMRGWATAHSRAEAPGSAALRSIGLTSGPSPPLEMSASRSVRCGNCQKNCIATPPPYEWPTMVARSTSSTASRSRMREACAPSE